MPSVMTNGIRTHYEIQGSGPALIFVSGLGGTAAYWRPQIEAFSREYTVVTYDQRGAGSSDHPPGPYSVETLVDDLQSLIEELQLERPTLIGHSTGGAIAQLLAAREPDLLAAMVQYASWARSDTHFNWCFRMRKALLIGSTVEEYVHGSALFLYPPEYLRTHGEGLSPALLASAARFPARAVVLSRINAIMAHDASAVLAAIKTPTLVLCAQDDILTPPYQSRILAEAIAHAELKIVPHGGHSFSESETELFNHITLDFVAKIHKSAKHSQEPS